MNIIEAIEDPRFFRPLFRDISTWRGWIVFLKSVFGIPISDAAELSLFESCTGLTNPKNTRAREVYCIAGRRSGKSWISSIIAVYLACFKDWRPYLSPGERGMIFIVACDKVQSSIIKQYISGILHSNRRFEKMIIRETAERIDLLNNITIMVKTASYRSIRGFTLLCAILEELAFWRSDETSSDPDKEILNAVRSCPGDDSREPPHRNQHALREKRRSLGAIPLSLREREIPINDELLPVLLELKAKNKGRYVVEKTNDKPYNRGLWLNFKRLARKLGMEDVIRMFHHTFASYMIMGGVDIVTVKELLATRRSR